MTSIYRKDNLEPFTESVATSSGVGSKGWGYEPMAEARQLGLSTKATSASGPARSRERTFTSGTGSKPASFSTGWNTPEQPGDFSVRSSGNIGQEILDESGVIVAWTTDAVLAHRITRLLNEDN